jgi:type 1 glutamine amidotransferase
MRLKLGILWMATVPLFAQQFSVLVFSKTAGYRHSSIPTGIEAIRQLGAKNGFTVTATEDSAQFTVANLTQFKAVIFLNTTGDVLDSPQEAALESYIRNGGGFVGVHSATDTEYNWSFYGRLICAYFHSHPKIQAATVRIADHVHPSTASLPESLTRTDEWYNFRTNPRGTAHVLATVDETTYTGGNMGDHPVSWCHDFEGGRVWYTAMGHTEASYTEPAFLTHLLGGIRTAAGVEKANCAVTPEERKPQK